MGIKKEAIIIVSLATSFLTSCSIFSSSISLNKRERKEVINVVYDEEDEEYTREFSEQFFVPNQDGYMYYEDGNILKSLYERKYSKLYPDYQSFKTDVLNNNIDPPFPKGMSRDGIIFDTSERFLVDSLVLYDFKQYSLSKFIEKYCHVDEHNRLRFNDNYPDTQCTVAYCLWLTGKYVFCKGGFVGDVYIDKDSTLNALYNLRHQK